MIERTNTPPGSLLEKLYDQGEYEFYNVLHEGSVIAVFALAFRGDQAWFCWSIVIPGPAQFRAAKEDLPELKTICRERGATALLCATGDPARDPDFIRMAKFFGFIPTAITAAQEV